MTLNYGQNIQTPESISLWAEVLRFFPPELRMALGKVQETLYPIIIELRIRVNQPFEINCCQESYWLREAGGITSNPAQAMIISSELLKKIIQAITTGSLYALDDDIAQGYIALPGGHRVGFSGKAVLHSGEIRFIRHISGLNFRIARQIKGIARPVLPLLYNEGRILKTLVLSPPACGKTTLLRDIIRELSYGVPGLKVPAFRIGLVDERSEVAGCYQGIPQMDLGPRTDVLDSCPKKIGVYLLLRSMNPQLIVTDEVGRNEDLAMIEDMINAGVGFIITAHARNLVEAMQRPGLKRIMETGVIERFIVLSNRRGVGTIESISAGIGSPELWPVRK